MVIAAAVPAPVPSVAVGGDGVGIPAPACDLGFPSLTGFSSFSSSSSIPSVSLSQETPVPEKRQTEDSPGGVDGTQGEDGATPRKRRGRPSRVEKPEEDQGSREPWIKVGGARVSPFTSSRLSTGYACSSSSAVQPWEGG